MGWDVTQVGKNITTKQFVESEYNKLPNWELLAIGQGKRVHGDVPFYLALKQRDGNEVVALIVLSNRRNGQIALKSMDENMGPYVYDCPKSVFKLLTPTTNEFALAWRAKVQEQLTAPKLAVGDTVNFESAIEFQNGYKDQTFTWLGGSKFASVSGGKYRITNWRSFPYTITKQEKAVA